MIKPAVSSRGRLTPESPIRKLASYAQEAKAKGTHVYHLNIGQPDIPTPPEFFQAVHAFTKEVLEYGPSGGMQDFIESLEHYFHGYGYSQIESKDIMVTTGGSEAILFSMLAVTSPGDEIIVFEPFYPNYNGFAHMAGIRLIPVASPPENGYHLPPVELIQEKVTSRTKAILICSPNNPTGTILTYQEMDAIVRLAEKNGLFVLSDEVYREFTFDGTHTSIMSFPQIGEQAILMDSLSKRYSACGARIGCIVSKNKEIISTVLKFGQSRLCPPTLEQVAARALVEKGHVYFKAMLQEYKERRDCIVEKLHEIPGVRCMTPQGAFYLMVTFPVSDIEMFSKWLLTDFHVDGQTTMIAPGPGFYATPGLGKKEARIAYVLKKEALGKAVDILKEGIKAFNR